MSETDRRTFDEKEILDYLNIEVEGDVEWRRASLSASHKPGDWYVFTEPSVCEAQPYELGKYAEQVEKRRVFHDEGAQDGMHSIRTIFYLNAQPR